jgi:hypothetical protein
MALLAALATGAILLARLGHSLARAATAVAAAAIAAAALGAGAAPSTTAMPTIPHARGRHPVAPDQLAAPITPKASRSHPLLALAPTDSKNRPPVAADACRGTCA